MLVVFLVRAYKNRHTELSQLSNMLTLRTADLHLPDAVAVHRGGRLVYANPAAVTMLGAQSAQDLIGRRMCAARSRLCCRPNTDRLGGARSFTTLAPGFD